MEDINGKVFNGNSVFKTGDFFKNSYCVYSGIPTNITVTGLTKYTICYFSAFAYNPNNNLYCIEKQVGNVRSRWTLR